MRRDEEADPSSPRHEDRAEIDRLVGLLDALSEVAGVPVAALAEGGAAIASRGRPEVCAPFGADRSPGGRRCPGGSAAPPAGLDRAGGRVIQLRCPAGLAHLTCPAIAGGRVATLVVGPLRPEASGGAAPLEPAPADEACRAAVRLAASASPQRIESLAILLEALARSRAEGREADPRDRDDVRRALVESEARFRVAFERATVGMSLTAIDGTLSMVNPAFCAMLGYGAEELGVIKWSTVTHPDDVAESAECVRCLLAGERDTYQMEKRYLHRDGRVVWAAVSTILARDAEGRPAHFITQVLDITGRRRADEELRRLNERLARSNEDLEQFAYVASHDLQEPLRMVASYTQLLARRYGDRLDGDAREFIAFAVDGANRMQSLIQDLLVFSRVTTRGRPMAPLDAHDVLGEALRDLRVAIEEAGALVTNGDLPQVIGDPVQIAQVFRNLIGNALKFRRPDEAPRVHVAARPSPGAPGLWTFSVRDNGIGIEARHFDRLFVIFQRLHGRHEHPGTGIGLALCKRIVERHGGRIWLESTPDRGSTFFFTLPAHGAGEGM